MRRGEVRDRLLVVVVVALIGRGELFAVYAGLASGRMVVVGGPGAGKSGTAVLLVLDALTHREGVEDTERARVPVPVLFTAHGWDPTTCSVQDWLAGRLAATYPLFQHRGGQDDAAALIAAGAVALVLDGLDEMDGARRPAVLQALSDAPFRVVVLTRSQEMVQAAGAAWLVGALALHLHDVTGPEAADYLHRARTGPPPLGWTELLTHLREDPDSALSRGLSTPLALTLIRDTYRAGDDVRELLDITTRQATGVDIERHLIARVLPVAYTRPTGPAETPLQPPPGYPGARIPRPADEPRPHPRPGLVAHPAMGPHHPPHPHQHAGGRVHGRDRECDSVRADLPGRGRV